MHSSKVLSGSQMLRLRFNTEMSVADIWLIWASRVRHEQSFCLSLYLLSQGHEIFISCGFLDFYFLIHITFLYVKWSIVKRHTERTVVCWFYKYFVRHPYFDKKKKKLCWTSEQSKRKWPLSEKNTLIKTKALKRQFQFCIFISSLFIIFFLSSFLCFPKKPEKNDLSNYFKRITICKSPLTHSTLTLD